MIVPPDQLSAEALERILDDFILRDGTDYGLHEMPHDQKKEQLRRQIRSGNVVILFDAETESLTLRNKEDAAGVI